MSSLARDNNIAACFYYPIGPLNPEDLIYTGEDGHCHGNVLENYRRT